MRRYQHWSVVAARCSAAVAPPPVVVGGEGGERAGDEGRAKLGDGVATFVVAGEGAIDPAELPPMVQCGREGAAAGTMSLHRSHDAEYPDLSWSLSRIPPNPSHTGRKNGDGIGDSGTSQSPPAAVLFHGRVFRRGP
jgi:hypothetical protein